MEIRQSPLIELVDHGAPQGSVLGGTLFIINENDFPACRIEGESVMFVDDDTDCVSHEDPIKLTESIQREADLSCQWLKDNRMCVAGQKSKLLVMGTKSIRNVNLRDREITILVDGQLIRESKSEKLLGVVINNEMTWKGHL